MFLMILVCPFEGKGFSASSLRYRSRCIPVLQAHQLVSLEAQTVKVLKDSSVAIKIIDATYKATIVAS